MTPAGFYFDPQTLAGLREIDDQRQTLERVAQQFEALFVHMLLKQMREASVGDGLFDSSQSEFYRDMFDAQMAQHVGGQAGLGIAQLLVKELGRNLPQAAASSRQAAPATAAAAQPVAELQHAAADRTPDHAPPPAAAPPVGWQSTAGAAPHPRGSTPAVQWFASAAPGRMPSLQPAAPEPAAPGETDWRSPQEFLAHLQPFARQAARELGVSSDVLLAQATLETGWGSKLPRHPDGRSSFNLFGIKADARWTGDSVTKPTLEYIAGAMRREHAQFRSYASAHESFKDYASFLKSNPRYADALAVANDPAAYLHALQNAGYATDPRYADKILSLVQSGRFREALPPAAPKESGDDAV